MPIVTALGAASWRALLATICVLGCGLREPPAPESAGGTSGAGGGAGTQSGGDAGEAAAGAGGSPEACPEEVFQLDACVSPALDPQASKRVEQRGLTVRSAVAPDARFCNAPGYRYASWLATPASAFQAYELENADGDVWTVQLAVGPVSFDLLTPGDTVDLTVRGALSPYQKTGYVALSTNGSPRVIVTSSELPAMSKVPDLAFRDAGPECGPRCPGQPFLIEVTAGGESALLHIGETAEVGGLTFRKALATNSDGCCADCTKRAILAVFDER